MGTLLKIAILLAAGAAIWWMLVRPRRSNRQTPVVQAERPATLPMARCHHCGVFAPQGEMVPGRLGMYCCAQHRALDEPIQD